MTTQTVQIPLYIDTSKFHECVYPDPIEIKLTYTAQNKDSSSNAVISMDLDDICLNNITKSYIIQASKSILLQSEYFEHKFKNDWKDHKRIEFTFNSLKQLEAFREVIKYMHYTELDLSSFSANQGIHRIKPGNGMDIELCIAANMLSLSKLQIMLEQRLINSLHINNILQAIFYASTYRSKAVLLYCFKWILMHGVSLAYRSSDVPDVIAKNRTNTSENKQLIFIVSKKMFFYNGYSIYSDVFDAIISDRQALEYYYFAPGYKSSGGRPCQIDILHRKSPLKPPPGFINTTRCYIERIKGLGDTHDIQKFNLYREDTGSYILTGIYIPRHRIVIFINNKTFTDYNNITVYDSLIGYMKYNRLITNFTLYDNGISHEILNECVFPNLVQKPRCFITYKTNLTGRVPNSLMVKFNVNKELFEDQIDGHYFFDESFVNNLNQRKEKEQEEAKQVLKPISSSSSITNKLNLNESLKEESLSKTLNLSTLTPGTTDPSETISTNTSTIEEDEEPYTEPPLPLAPMTLVTKPATWNQQMKSWTLKFNQRSKVASKKNFQLIDEDTINDENPQVILLLGKISSKRYSLDYASPLSSCQALAIAITAFVKKILVN